jgi:hypothetical protein
MIGLFKKLFGSKDQKLQKWGPKLLQLVDV